MTNLNVNPLLIPGTKVSMPRKGKFRNIRYQRNLAAVRKYNQTIINSQQAPMVQAIRSAENVATRYIVARAAQSNRTDDAINTYNKVIAGAPNNRGSKDDEKKNNEVIIN